MLTNRFQTDRHIKSILLMSFFASQKSVVAVGGVYEFESLLILGQERVEEPKH